MPVWLLPILSALPGMIGKYFEQKNAIQTQKLSNELAMEQEKNKLIAQGMVVQGELGQEQIKATSAWFKQLVYCVMLAPAILACVDPIKGQIVFAALGMVPEWYIGLIVTIGLAMWGINSDKLQSLIQSRREYSLAKLDRKVYFDALRRAKGSLSQQEVDVVTKALDEAEK